MADKYRCLVHCEGCGKKYRTDAKSDRSAPNRHYESREDGCGSTETNVIDSWPVN